MHEWSQNSATLLAFSTSASASVCIYVPPRQMVWLEINAMQEEIGKLREVTCIQPKIPGEKQPPLFGTSLCTDRMEQDGGLFSHGLLPIGGVLRLWFLQLFLEALFHGFLLHLLFLLVFYNPAEHRSELTSFRNKPLYARRQCVNLTLKCTGPFHYLFIHSFLYSNLIATQVQRTFIINCNNYIIYDCQ